MKIVDNAKDFTDTQGHWAEASIDFATSHELFSGTSATTFTPDRSMTRAMLMTVLGRGRGPDLRHRCRDASSPEQRHPGAGGHHPQAICREPEQINPDERRGRNGKPFRPLRLSYRQAVSRLHLITPPIVSFW